MKAFTLSFASLCLVALAQAQIDYNLKCTKDEIGIRWPSYHSNSDYYVCQQIGGKQVKVTCEDGDLFTFVLQSCTAPNKFIPPPPMDILPTASPLPGYLMPLQPSRPSQPSHPSPAGINYPGLTALPQPIHPGDVSPLHQSKPPVVFEEHPPTLEKPNDKPHHIDIDASEHKIPAVDDILESPSNTPLSPSKPNSDASVPLPPTPVPTPPALQTPPKKAPQLPGKKQPALPNKNQLKSPGKKQPTGAAKKPNATVEKKQSSPAAKKQQAKAGKKQPPTLAKSANKKAPKTPTKA